MSLYSKICIWLINLLLVFIVGNLIAFIVVPSNSLKDIDHADARVNNFIQALGDEKLQQLYPQRTPAQILELLSNQARAISVYQPFTQFRLPDYRSATFNSSTPGYRHIGNMQGPWPIADGAYNIFLFGGSTTMGSGVADDETVGAFLQTQLRALGGPKFSRANVYNFGTGAYFSTQERLAFEQIALSSTKPDIAIFIDGINDLIQWSGQPAFTPFLSSAAELLQQSWAFKGFGDLMAQSARKLPLVSLAYKLGAAQNAPTPFPQVDVDTSEFNDPARFKVAIDRYINNTRLADGVGKIFKIPTMFVLQPTLFNNYERQKDVLDLMKNFPSGQHYALRAKYGYPLLEKRFNTAAKSRTNLVSCVSALVASNKILYIDHVHYNIDGNSLLAQCITDAITRASPY